MRYFVIVSTFTILSLFQSTRVSAEEKSKPRPQNLTGNVSKIDAASLTIVQRGDSGVRTTSFTISPDTKIFLETSEDETVKRGEGAERKIPKTMEGKTGDIKVDQRATVTFTEAGKADSVLILRPSPARKKKEEER